MRILLISCLLAIIAVALIGVEASSATALCKTTTTPCDSGYGKGTTLDASMTSGTTAILKSTSETVLDTCTAGTVKGTTANAGGGEAEEPVTGTVETLSFSSCSRTTHTLKTGEFEIQKIAETDDGTLISRNAEITVDSIFGSCVFGTASGTDLGTLKGGESPTIEVNAVVPKISGNGACPAHAVLTASYTLTEPKPLYVEGN